MAAAPPAFVAYLDAFVSEFRNLFNRSNVLVAFKFGVLPIIEKPVVSAKLRANIFRGFTLVSRY